MYIVKSEPLEIEFPVSSQSSDFDKLAIVKIRDIFSKIGEYNYCEIGSYLGGSLTPFLRDNNCTYILSVDDRGKILSDERGVGYDYRPISHQTMLDNLSGHNLDLSKLETFDGPIYKASTDTKFDLIFIDAEHTDQACFKDFIYSQKLLKENAVIMFHDSNLLYKSLQIIQELLDFNCAEYKFIKIKNSSVSFIFFGDYVDLYKEFDIEDNETFYYNSEREIIQHLIDNRVSSKFTVKRKTYVGV